MWQADEWKDYEVLDTSRGEKLERWGKYVLVRPTRRSSGTRRKMTRCGGNTTRATAALQQAAAHGRSTGCRSTGKFDIKN